MIPFNKPFIIGNEIEYMEEAVNSCLIAGDGCFSKKCHEWFESRYNIDKALLTTSCTDALEMATLLCNIQPGDEIILPSFTFVSTANAFVLRGASIIFADSMNDSPNIDVNKVEELITKKTKAIVPVHYAGIACNMDHILSIAEESDIFVIEDAAQAIEATYNNKQLGTLGDIGTFSFHETKNVICGEGGLIAINNEEFITRSEIIREKGTNRSAFFRGEIDKYSWVDVGSSFLPSDLIAAYLYAQLENVNKIQEKRMLLWNRYYKGLKKLEEMELIVLPKISKEAKHNGHIFYIVNRSLEERNSLLSYLRGKEIFPVFHYQSLHRSPYYVNKHDGRELPHSDRFSDCLLRLPMYYELTIKDVDLIVEEIINWSKNYF